MTSIGRSDPGLDPFPHFPHIGQVIRFWNPELKREEKYEFTEGGEWIEI